MPFDEAPICKTCISVKALEASLCNVDVACLVHHLQTSGMTDKKQLLKRFTHHQLKWLKNWPDWDDAFDVQLDAHHKAGCISTQVLQPAPSDG